MHVSIAVVVIFFILMVPKTFAQRYEFVHPNSPAYNYIPENVKHEIRVNVDWIFLHAGNAAPASVIAWRYPVLLYNGFSTASWYRMDTGARSCGAIAIIYTLAGRKDVALTWIAAAQSQNQNVVNLFYAYPDYALSYACATHMNAAVSFSVPGPLYQWIANVRQVFKI